MDGVNQLPGVLFAFHEHAFDMLVVGWPCYTIHTNRTSDTRNCLKSL